MLAETDGSTQFFRGAVLVLITATLIGLPPGMLQASESPGLAEWDRSLPAVLLENVQFKATSLADAWSRLGRAMVIRTVLYSEPEVPGMQQEFLYSAARCRVSELLDALVATYPDMTWTQDETSGVIWIHSRRTAYATILAQKIEVLEDEPGLPMLTGLLEPLSLVDESFRVRTGGLARFTYNYPIDLGRGAYSLRDMVNICCLANPTKSFCVYALPGGRFELTPFNFSSDRALPAPGALHIWRLGIGPVTDEGPGVEDLRQRLADRDSNVRAAARFYLEAERRRFELERMVEGSEDGGVAAWVAVGIMQVICRAEGATFSRGIQRLQREATKGLLENASPELALLAGMELARLGHDPRYLNTVAQRKLRPGELDGVRARVFAMARQSEALRENLAGALGRRLAGADPSFARLVDPAMPLVPDFKLHEATQTRPQH